MTICTHCTFTYFAFEGYLIRYPCLGWTQDKNFLYLSCLGFVLGQPVLSWVLSWVRFFEKFLSCLGLVLCLVIWSRNSNCTIPRINYGPLNS